MVRAPCCEKMGLKKGPWTSEEDQILVSYIHKHGHGNWRALPKQAGLLRCGKSCRLRWTNYLRPDIKRGNFSKEEEETIISLHEMLGNRWSAIAAKLPGRTDNEIKNVWHTHLKKRLMPMPEPNETGQESKLKKRSSGKAKTDPKPKMAPQRLEEPRPVSPAQSCSDNSSVATSNESGSKEESMDSFEEFPEIDESFWSEALSMDSCNAVMDTCCAATDPFGAFSSSTVTGEDMDFWLKVFMEAGDLQDLTLV